MFSIKSLRTKSLLCVLIPTVLTLPIAAAIGLYAVEQMGRGAIQQRDAELARLLAAQLAEDVNQYSRILQIIAAGDDVQSMETARLSSALENAQHQIYMFDGGVVIYDSEGIALWSHPLADERRGTEFPVPSKFDKLRRTRQPVFSDVFKDAASDEEAILVGVPIIGHGGEFKGVVAGIFKMQYSLLGAVYAEVIQLKMIPTAYTYLTDGNGRVIYHPDGSQMGKTLAITLPVMRAKTGETGAVLTEDPTGEDVILGFAPVPHTGWMLVIQQRWDAVSEKIIPSEISLLSLLTVGGVLSSGLILFSIGRILRPIRELTRGTQRIAEGDFDHTVVAQTGDEIEILAHQFNAMADALKKSYAGLERRVADCTRELSTLLQVSHNVASKLELEPLLIWILDQLKFVVDYDGASILQLDEETLRVLAYRGPIPQEEALQLSFSLEEAGATLEAIRQEKPMIIPDVRGDTPLARTFREIAKDRLKTTLGHVRSWMGVPLIIKDQMVGMLSLDHGKPDYYTSQQAELAIAIANQAVMAIENAKLYTSVQQELAEREQVEKALTVSRARLEQLLTVSPAVIWVGEPWGDYTTTFMSGNVKRQLGYEPQEFTDEPRFMADHIHPEDADRIFLELDRLSEQEYHTREYRFEHKDGTYRWIRDEIRLMYDPEGNPAEIVGCWIDITERKQAEENLQKERDFISAVLDTAGALVVVLDPQGRIVRFNRACEQLTGYSFDEVRGRHVWDLFLIPEDVGSVKAVFGELRAGRFPNEHENYWVARDGSRRLIAWSNTALLDDKGSVEYIIGTGIDIEEERRGQREAAVLAEVAKLVSGTLDLDEVLDLTAEYAIDVFKADHCLIALYEESGGTLRFAAEKGFTPGIAAAIREDAIRERELRPSDKVRETVLEALQPLAVEDVSAEPHVAPQLLEFLGLQSVLVVPVRAGQRTLGIMQLSTQRPRRRHFTAQEGELAMAMANQAAVAIDNAQHHRAEQRRAEQFRAISEVGRRMTFVLPIDDLLGEIVQLLREALGYYLVDIALIEEDELVFKAGAGAVWEIPGFRPPRLKVGQEGITGWVAQSGKPLLVPDVSQEPRYYALPQASEMQSELAVPLKTKERVIGVLHAQSTHLNGFDESDLVVLQSLAHQAAIAIENARLYEHSRELAVLEERNRLARELHDSVTQSLYSLSLLAEGWRRMVSAGQEERVEDYLGRISEIAQQALKEMRLLIYELRPPVLEQEGLWGALHQRLDAVENRAGVEARLLVEDLIELPASVEEGLYRIVQEALNNGLKHAAATSVTVRVRACGEQVVLEVTDNGRGFDPEAAEAGAGMGLVSMRERAQQMGGTLTIRSAPGEGTTVGVAISV